MELKMLLGKRENNAFQTLEGHTLDTLGILKGLLRRPSFKAFCQRWELDEDTARLSIVATVLFHDIGKATGTFQKALKQNKHLPDFPHPLVALPVINEIWQRKSFPKLWQGFFYPLLEMLAVVSHHSLLYSDLYRLSIRQDALLDFLPETGELLRSLFAHAAREFGLS